MLDKLLKFIKAENESDKAELKKAEPKKAEDSGKKDQTNQDKPINGNKSKEGKIFGKSNEIPEATWHQYNGYDVFYSTDKTTKKEPLKSQEAKPKANVDEGIDKKIIINGAAPTEEQKSEVPKKRYSNDSLNVGMAEGSKIDSAKIVKKDIVNGEKKGFSDSAFAKSNAIIAVLFELDDNFIKCENSVDKLVDNTILFMKQSMYDKYYSIKKEYFTFGAEKESKLASNKATYLCESLIDSLEKISNMYPKLSMKEVVQIVVVGKCSSIISNEETCKVLSALVSTLRMKNILTTFMCEGKAYMPFLASLGFRTVEELKLTCKG